MNYFLILQRLIKTDQEFDELIVGSISSSCFHAYSGSKIYQKLIKMGGFDAAQHCKGF